MKNKLLWAAALLALVASPAKAGEANQLAGSQSANISVVISSEQAIANPRFYLGITHNNVGGQLVCAGSSSLEEASVQISELQVIVISPANPDDNFSRTITETHGYTPTGCWQFLRATMLQNAKRVQLIRKIKR